MPELTTRTFRTPHGRPVEMTYRLNTNDYNTLNATLNEDEYHLPSGLTGHAVDVGGYLGSVGIALASDNPGLQVTIIEPVPSNQQLIRQNIAQNDLDHQVTLIEGAVGRGGESVDVWFGYRGTETAEHHAFVGNSSLAYDHGGALEHETATYTAIGLGELGDIAFLKIDCEGGEWAFLHGPALANVQTIVGEAHSVRGHKGRDIIALLATTHDTTITPVPDDPEGNGTVEFAAVRR